MNQKWPYWVRGGVTTLLIAILLLIAAFMEHKRNDNNLFSFLAYIFSSPSEIVNGLFHGIMPDIFRTIIYYVLYFATAFGVGALTAWSYNGKSKPWLKIGVLFSVYSALLYLPTLGLILLPAFMLFGQIGVDVPSESFFVAPYWWQILIGFLLWGLFGAVIGLILRILKGKPKVVVTQGSE